MKIHGGGSLRTQWGTELRRRLSLRINGALKAICMSCELSVFGNIKYKDYTEEFSSINATSYHTSWYIDLRLLGAVNSV